MDNLFEKIYELTYNPLVTPYNLLTNIQLENYHEINYKKIDSQLVAEVICSIDDKIETFRYIFDSNNYLLKILILNGSKEDVLFDRKTSLSSERRNFIRNSSTVENIV